MVTPRAPVGPISILISSCLTSIFIVHHELICLVLEIEREIRIKNYIQPAVSQHCRSFFSAVAVANAHPFLSVWRPERERTKNKLNFYIFYVFQKYYESALSENSMSLQRKFN